MRRRPLRSKIVYQNPWITVKQDDVIFPSGKKGIYGVVTMADTVAVLAKEHNHIYLVKQYRYTIRRQSWELPSGHVEKNETPLQAAKRELREEAGLTAKEWKSFGFFRPALGIMNSKRYLFFAQKLSRIDIDREDSERSMVVKKVSLQKVRDMVRKNIIFDDYTITALYKLAIL